MKNLFLCLLCLIGFTSLSQDSLIIKIGYPPNDELRNCWDAKDQLKYLDNLIIRYQERLNQPNGNYSKFYRKLLIYHINAGNVAFKRGAYAQCLYYFIDGQKYTDSLTLNFKAQTDNTNMIRSFNVLHENFCFQVYQVDTTTFFDCNCVALFPELMGVEETETVNQPPPKKHSSPSKKVKNIYGQFYQNDTLRLHKPLTTDDFSIHYFKQNQQLILSKIKYKAFPEIMREPLFPERSDTLILQITISPEAEKITRECKIIFSNCRPLFAKYYLHLFSNMEFPFAKEKVTFHIPIILKPETPNNYNKMDRIIIGQDHFLIEYETIRRVKVH